MGKQAGINDSGHPLLASLIQNRVRDNRPCRLTATRIPRCRLESMRLSQSHALQVAWQKCLLRTDLHRPWPSRMGNVDNKHFETFAASFSPGTYTMPSL